VSVAEPRKLSDRSCADVLNLSQLTAKERAGGGFDDDKFAGNWRRDGPLPTPPSPRGHSRDLERGGSGFSSKFGGADRDRDGPKSAEAENNDDWRSNRPARTTSMAPPSPRLGNAGLAGPPMERAGSIRKTSGFVSTAGDGSHPADKEEVWSIGSKFKPSEVKEEKRSLFGGRRGDSLREPAVVTKLDEEGDWRSAPRKSPVGRPSQLDGTSRM
jgi:translation initiation factor 4B